MAHLVHLAHLGPSGPYGPDGTFALPSRELSKAWLGLLTLAASRVTPSGKLPTCWYPWPPSFLHLFLFLTHDDPLAFLALPDQASLSLLILWTSWSVRFSCVALLCCALLCPVLRSDIIGGTSNLLPNTRARTHTFDLLIWIIFSLPPIPSSTKKSKTWPELC